MINPNDQARTLRMLASRLSLLRPSSNSDIAGIGLMTGALHGLVFASELGYADEASQPDPSRVAAEFRDALTELRDATHPSPVRLAGLFFHSAIVQLGALDERVAGSIELAADMRRTVDSLKHRTNAHIGGDHPVTFAEAVTAAKDLCGILVESVPSEPWGL
jgi:hypothetical protein